MPLHWVVAPSGAHAAVSSNASCSGAPSLGSSSGREATPAAARTHAVPPRQPGTPPEREAPADRRGEQQHAPAAAASRPGQGRTAGAARRGCSSGAAAVLGRIHARPPWRAPTRAAGPWSSAHGRAGAAAVLGRIHGRRRAAGRGRQGGVLLLARPMRAREERNQERCSRVAQLVSSVAKGLAVAAGKAGCRANR